MAIRDIVTRGFGNGTYSGSIPLVVTRGFAIGEVVAPVIARLVASTDIRPVLMADADARPRLQGRASL